MLMMRRACVAVGFVAFSAVVACAQTLTAETRGRIEFAAPTFATLGEFSKNAPSANGKAAVDIDLPQGSGPYPAMIVAHTVGGWNPDVEGDAVRRLLAAGYAVGALDHFGPRGIRQAAVSGFNPLTTAADALIALKLLATHPRIDARRIGIIGFSLGGMTSMLTAFEQVRHRFAGDARFAAHVSFYGPCSYVALDARSSTTGAPLLLLFGDKDETTLRGRCDQLERLMREGRSGQTVRSIWYTDAYHGWNNPKFRDARFFPEFRSGRACPLMDVGARFGFIHADGAREPFTPAALNDCVRKGAGYSLGYSEAVTERSWRDALAFLDGHLEK